MQRTLMLALVAASVWAQGPRLADPPTTVLSESRVQQLEAQVSNAPTDAASQALLGKNYAYFILGVTALGDYDRVIGVDPAKAASKFASHARQQLTNMNSAGVCGEGGFALWNTSFRVEGSLTARPPETATLVSARALAAQAVDRAITLEPAAGIWRNYRVSILIHRANFGGDLHLSATEAFRQVKQDMAVLKGITRDAQLPGAARLAVNAQAFNDARSYAREMLDGADNAKDWNQGNWIFFGNMVLGQLALRAGDKDRAADYLLASGKTPGSPQLNSFGPNMLLAKELIEAGAREPVLKFLAECGHFWQKDQGRLKTWAEQVAAEKTPDFGSNLFY
jgi:hypothetical protein